MDPNETTEALQARIKTLTLAIGCLRGERDYARLECERSVDETDRLRGRVSRQRKALATLDAKLAEARRVNETHREENERLQAECEAMRAVVEAAQAVAALLTDVQLQLASQVTFPTAHLHRLHSLCVAVAAHYDLTGTGSVGAATREDAGAAPSGAALPSPTDPPDPLPPIVAEVLRRACHDFGSEDTFNLANLSHVISRMLGIRGPIDGNRLRLALQSCPCVEQLHGGAHYRVTCCTLPLPVAATRKDAGEAPPVFIGPISGLPWEAAPTDPPDTPDPDPDRAGANVEAQQPAPASVEPTKPEPAIRCKSCRWRAVLDDDEPCLSCIGFYNWEPEPESKPAALPKSFPVNTLSAALARAEKAEAELARVREACNGLISNWYQRARPGVDDTRETRGYQEALRDVARDLARAALQPPERKDGGK
jgi:hypothetical protein